MEMGCSKNTKHVLLSNQYQSGIMYWRGYVQYNYTKCIQLIFKNQIPSSSIYTFAILQGFQVPSLHGVQNTTGLLNLLN